MQRLADIMIGRKRNFLVWVFTGYQREKRKKRFQETKGRDCSNPPMAGVSVINAEGPPVPIPNTEVKLCSGDNTWLETAREDSSMLTQT